MEKFEMRDLQAGEEKLKASPVDGFTVPVGGQEITLQQIDYVHGGASLLRLRIREGKRFTVFDIDAVTAARWGKAMSRWASTQDGVLVADHRPS